MTICNESFIAVCQTKQENCYLGAIFGHWWYSHYNWHYIKNSKLKLSNFPPETVVQFFLLEKRCPNDCSGQGECNFSNGICACNNGHGGADCSGQLITILYYIQNISTQFFKSFGIIPHIEGLKSTRYMGSKKFL